MRSREDGTRLLAFLCTFVCLVLSVTVAYLVTPSGRAVADGPTPVGCSPGAIENAITDGGSYQFDCTGTVYVPQNINDIPSPFVVPSGTSVSFQTTGQSVALNGLGESQIFIVDPGASLTLNNVTLEDGIATGTSGTPGSAGLDGTSGVPGPTGIDGSPAGPFTGSSGQTGATGTSGSSGQAGTPGTDADGGAIYNAGNLTLTESTIQGNEAVAADGGNGGQGGAGGDGGRGGDGGAGATPNTQDTGGSGGNGGQAAHGTDSGGGGNGGAAGNADGGAIYNAPTGTATIDDCAFTNNTATGGNGGQGGHGGTGGSGVSGGQGGNGATGNNTDGGAGGTGGTGGDGAAGGRGGEGGIGGEGAGGAIYNNGGNLTIWVSDFQNNTANGGNGGTGGAGGSGSAGGQGGQGGNGGDAYQPAPDQYAGSGGAAGANGQSGQSGLGGNGAMAGTGGSALGGAIYSTTEIHVDGKTIPTPTLAGPSPGFTPTSFTDNTVTAGSTPNGCTTNNSGCGGPGGAGVQPYPPATSGAPADTQGPAGAATTPGAAGENAPDNTATVAVDGPDAWIDGNNGLTTTPTAASTTTPSGTNPSGSQSTGSQPTVGLRVEKIITIVGTDASNPPPKSGHLTPAAIQAAESTLENDNGFHPHPYDDPVPTSASTGTGICAIGYGTKLHNGPCAAADRAKWKHSITKQHARQLLESALPSAAAVVSRYTYASLSNDQQTAIVEFAYDVGGTAFRGSTFLHDLNDGDQTPAANQLQRWIRINGDAQPVLVSRRRQERNLMLARSPENGTHTTLGLSAPKTSARFRAGHTATLTGDGARPGCEVLLIATVTGVSPYRAISLPHVTAGVTGSYTIKWHIPAAITDTLPWQITGSQRCGR